MSMRAKWFHKGHPQVEAGFALRALLIGVVAAAAMACGSESSSSADASSSDGLAADATATTDASAAGDSSGSADTSTPSFKAICSASKPCATGKMCASGVCTVEPKAEQVAEVTDPGNDYLPTKDKVELGCVDQPFEDQIKGQTGPTAVTMWGRVDRFGGGGVTVNVEVAVFELAKFHPEACVGIEDDDKRDACFLSDKVGKPIGTTVSVDPDKAAEAGLDLASAKKADEGCSKHMDCPGGYECRKESGAVQKICIRTHGVYAIDNVPTNTRLVVRVRGLNAKDKWHPGYYWDIVLFAGHTDAKGAGKQPSKYLDKDTYRVNPTIVGEGQWTLVPNTLGVGEIEYPHGVIGGRIRDCGVTGGRGGWAIHNAKVGLGVQPKGFAYFNDNEDDTVPVKTNTATDTLGRFAAVDLMPGANRIAATSWVDGKATSLGGVDVFVIPDALMIVSLPGRIPVLSK